MESNKSEMLVLGIGNDILTDDAIGPKLVKRLKADSKVDGALFETAAVGGMQVLDFMGGFKRAIIIDAIRTDGGTPGDVYHLTPDNFKETLHLSSFHDMNFLVALEFAKKMEIDIPAQIDIIAIEIVEDLTFSNDFSPSIEKKYNEIYLQVAILVEKLLAF